MFIQAKHIFGRYTFIFFLHTYSNRLNRKYVCTHTVTYTKGLWPHRTVPTFPIRVYITVYCAESLHKFDTASTFSYEREKKKQLTHQPRDAMKITMLSRLFVFFFTIVVVYRSVLVVSCLSPIFIISLDYLSSFHHIYNWQILKFFNFIMYTQKLRNDFSFFLF